MKLSFDANVLRWYLRDVYFINGTAYAGKSTMVRMLSERYGLIACGKITMTASRRRSFRRNSSRISAISAP